MDTPSVFSAQHTRLPRLLILGIAIALVVSFSARQVRAEDPSFQDLNFRDLTFNANEPQTDHAFDTDLSPQDPSLNLNEPQREPTFDTNLSFETPPLQDFLPLLPFELQSAVRTIEENASGITPSNASLRVGTLAAAAQEALDALSQFNAEDLIEGAGQRAATLAPFPFTGTSSGTLTLSSGEQIRVSAAEQFRLNFSDLPNIIPTDTTIFTTGVTFPNPSAGAALNPSLSFTQTGDTAAVSGAHIGVSGQLEPNVSAQFSLDWNPTSGLVPSTGVTADLSSLCRGEEILSALTIRSLILSGSTSLSNDDLSAQFKARLECEPLWVIVPFVEAKLEFGDEFEHDITGGLDFSKVPGAIWDFVKDKVF